MNQALQDSIKVELGFRGNNKDKKIMPKSSAGSLKPWSSRNMLDTYLQTFQK